MAGGRAGRRGVGRRLDGPAVTDPGDDPLAGATILGVLEESERRYLASRSRRRTLDKGQILFSEGQRSDSVLVLLSGHLKVLRYSQDGDPFIVDTVLPGNSIGEVGVFSKGPRSATVQAGEESVVLELPEAVIMDLISTRPAACIALLERVSAMVRRLTGVAADLVFLDLRQRVAKYLLDRRPADPRSRDNRLTQSEVAASIGASRQRVNACLREFERQGWISLESRRLRVVDRDGLARGARLS
jgi:CRP/FNR family cyclic AMP-dependent transcriptional regulator